MTAQSLLVELLVEELPPKALKSLGEAFAGTLFKELKARGLATRESVLTSFATPRRLAAHVTQVLARAPDEPSRERLMPASVAFKDGVATDAYRKRLAKLGRPDLADQGTAAQDGPDRIVVENDGKTDTVYFVGLAKGTSLQVGLQEALKAAIAGLPIPKVMTYHPETDRGPSLRTEKFVRPVHGLIALHEKGVVPVHLLGLDSGRTTQGHRFEAAVSPLVVGEADGYEAILERDGSVIAGFARRRAEIEHQIAVAAARVGGGAHAVADDALLDEVSALVERPNVLVCEFEKEFLEVPQECLILTMKANQKYFPLLDQGGKLTNRFLVVSNISPDDTSAVIAGNERVVRSRLADAKFFFDQDRKKTLDSRVEGLYRVVHHNKLGTVGERMERVRAIARAIGQQLGGDALAQGADAAARLTKADLLTDMVGEFPELQGIMGGYYARHDGLDADVAHAIEDHYRPRFAGDQLPRNNVGLVVALADKLETLVGMFGIGNAPTGDKDPFALRRHALGVIRMLVERAPQMDVDDLTKKAFQVLDDERLQRGSWDKHHSKAQGATSGSTDGAPSVHASGFAKRALNPDTVTQVLNFIFDRFAAALKEQGYTAQEIDAVLALLPQRLGDVPRRLAAVRAFAQLPEAPALAAANKRIANILKKAQDVDPHVSEVLLREPAEVALHAAMKAVAATARAHFEAGDYTESLKALAALRAPVDSFFDSVMVNAQETDVRLNRLGLLQSLHNAMNQVADLSKLSG